MRPYFVRSVALFVAVCFLATREGDAGPTGPAGAAGGDGATGPAGPTGDPRIVNYTADLNEANVGFLPGVPQPAPRASPSPGNLFCIASLSRTLLT